MFQYQESVSKGAPKLCTKEIWDQLIDSPEVKNICNRIGAQETLTHHHSACRIIQKQQARQC